MKKSTLFIFMLVSVLTAGAAIESMETIPAPPLSFSLSPHEVRQGDPFLIQLKGVEISSIQKATFDKKEIGIFLYQNKPTAIVGIDLNKKAGTYELTAELADGNIIHKNIEIEKRDKTEAPLGIPQKLGGNTKASQDKLVSSLAEDNKSLANLPTENKALWSTKFIPPLKQIFITAPYGNSRKTGAYSIPHKGVDYRASEGTDLFAVNRGIVRLTREFRNHGKTVVIDHGLGLMSFYLHLSEIKVKVGDMVEQGEIIGLSGQTGYTLGAHLHFSVRIKDVAIDPEKFLELFK